MSKWKKKEKLVDQLDKEIDEEENKELILKSLGKETPEATPEPVKVPEPEPVAVVIEPPKTYKVGFSPEKMRKSCGKCGGTQLLGEVVKETTGLSTKKIGIVYTCNDCKTKHELEKI